MQKAYLIPQFFPHYFPHRWGKTVEIRQKQTTYVEHNEGLQTRAVTAFCGNKIASDEIRCYSVQKKGLEPSWYCYHTDLNRARLPIPPFLQTSIFIPHHRVFVNHLRAFVLFFGSELQHIVIFIGSVAVVLADINIIPDDPAYLLIHLHRFIVLAFYRKPVSFLRGSLEPCCDL